MYVVCRCTLLLLPGQFLCDIRFAGKACFTSIGFFICIVAGVCTFALHNFWGSPFTLCLITSVRSKAFCRNPFTQQTNILTRVCCASSLVPTIYGWCASTLNRPAVARIGKTKKIKLSMSSCLNLDLDLPFTYVTGTIELTVTIWRTRLIYWWVHNGSCWASANISDVWSGDHKGHCRCN